MEKKKKKLRNLLGKITDLTVKNQQQIVNNCTIE